MSSPRKEALAVYSPPAGTMGESPDRRQHLMLQAGITEEEQVEAVKEAWQTKRSLLNARTTKVASHEGKITDTLMVEDNRSRLGAIESIERQLGVIAPRESQKVEVIHRLVLPDWALPDNTAKGQVIDITEIK